MPSPLPSLAPITTSPGPGSPRRQHLDPDADPHPLSPSRASAALLAASASSSASTSPQVSRPTSLYSPRGATTYDSAGRRENNGEGQGGRYGSVGGSRSRALMRPVRGGRTTSGTSQVRDPSASSVLRGRVPRPPSAASSSYSTALHSSSGREPWRFFSPNSIPNPNASLPLVMPHASSSQHPNRTQTMGETRPFSYAPSSVSTEDSEGPGSALGAWGVFAQLQQRDSSTDSRGRRRSSAGGAGGSAADNQSGFSLGRASTSSLGTVIDRESGLVQREDYSDVASMESGAGWDILSPRGARRDEDGSQLVSSPPSMLPSAMSSSSISSSTGSHRQRSSWTLPPPPPSPKRSSAGAPDQAFHDQIHHRPDESIQEEDDDEVRSPTNEDELLATPRASNVALHPDRDYLATPPVGVSPIRPMLSPRFTDQVPPSKQRQDAEGAKLLPTSPAMSAAKARKGLLQQAWNGLDRQKIDVLKCAIAYFLASLFTFNSTLNRLLPTPTSAHMVATISVYYNPAKSVGAMIEADLFCLFISLFTSLISLAAVGTLKAADAADSEAGDWLALFFWLGGAVSVLAWLKNWVGKASFNTAVSMGFLIMSIVIVKEGGLSKLFETLQVVVLGSAISNLVCFAIAPHSASSKLKSDINATLTSFSTLLSILSQTFLLDPHPSPLTSAATPSSATSPATALPPQTLAQAVAAHEKSFKGLKTNLAEAKSEFFEPEIAKTGKAYDAVVDSLTRLAQHLTGMRSGTGLQVELMTAQREGRIVLDDLDANGDRSGKGKGGMLSPSYSPTAVLTGKVEGVGRKAEPDYFGPTQEEPEEEDEFDEEDRKLAEDANLFAEVREHVGPQLRALTIASTTTLLKIRSTFDPSNRVVTDYDQLREELAQAHKAFQDASSGSILHLYGGGEDEKGEGGEVAKGPKESVFLVFYFIFTLDEFARELLFLLDSMGEITDQQRANETQSSFFGWRRVWGLLGRRRKRSATNGRRREPRALRKRMSRLIPIDPSEFIPAFPRKAQDAPGTVTNPDRESLSFKGRLLHTIWEMSSRARRQDIKYAFKVGMATTLLAAPAFTVTFKETFREYRGEWALVSFFATMAPTLGQTNFLGLHRILGTLFGALAASVVYSLFPENPYVLPIFGFFFSIPCYWYIVTKPVYASSGRFVLLTYNLTALYSYNVRERDTPVWSIAWHRFLSVSVGVIYTLIVSRYWWPYEARRELRNALSDFLIDLSFLYTRLVATFSGVRSTSDVSEILVDLTDDTDRSAEPPSEHSKLLQPDSTKGGPLSPSVREFMSMELHLQLALIDLRALLDAATKEPRLKGPFPRQLYNAILVSSQTMLDRFHSMRCVVNRDEWDSVVQRDFIRPVNRERRELVGNVLLYFSTLAAGFRLKTPLPPYLPPAEKARLRLLEKVESLTAIKRGGGGGARHLLFFSYVLAMAGIIKELEYLGGLQQDAFGVVGGSTADFEALFTVGEDDEGYD